MTPILYAHPFSSYCWKVLIALYENGTPFDYRMLGPDHPENGAELARLWPIGKFPVLVDDGKPVIESSVIVEYLDLHYPGPAPLLPRDPKAALEVRFMDRVFDNYIMNNMQKPVGNQLRPADQRDPHGVAQAKTALETAYGWLDGVLATRTWAAGETFTMADCSGAPSLFYADWVHQISDAFPHLRAYRTRVLAHPSVARVVDEARPYRPFFPLGAPDRD